MNGATAENGVGGEMTRPKPRSLADAAFDRLGRIGDGLDVHGHQVDSGRRQFRQEGIGVGRHEVTVEWQFGVAAQRGDHGQPEADVGDEMAVHDVEVKQIRLLLDGAHLFHQVSEIGGQQRRGDPIAGHRRRVYGGLFRLDDGDEHPVRPRQMRCQQQPIPPDPAGQSLRWSRPVPVHDLHGLGRHDGADRVDQAAAGRHQVESGGQHPFLEVGQFLDAVGCDPVPDLRSATQRSEPGTRGIEQYPVETCRTRSGGQSASPTIQSASGARCPARNTRLGLLSRATTPGPPIGVDQMHRLAPRERRPGRPPDARPGHGPRGRPRPTRDPGAGGSRASGFDHVGVRHARHRIPVRQREFRAGAAPTPVRPTSRQVANEVVSSSPHRFIQFRDEPVGKSQFQGPGLDSGSEIGLSPWPAA